MCVPRKDCDERGVRAEDDEPRQDAEAEDCTDLLRALPGTKRLVTRPGVLWLQTRHHVESHVPDTVAQEMWRGPGTGEANRGFNKETQGTGICAAFGSRRN